MNKQAQLRALMQKNAQQRQSTSNIKSQKELVKQIKAQKHGLNSQQTDKTPTSTPIERDKNLVTEEKPPKKLKSESVTGIVKIAATESLSSTPLPTKVFGATEGESTSKQSAAQSLPEGFFDEKQVQVEKTTPESSVAQVDLSKEWETFQQEISEDLHKIDGETEEKRISELDQQEEREQQIRARKVEALKQKQLELKKRLEMADSQKVVSSDRSNAQEIEDFDVFGFDWRSKKV